MGTDPSLKKPIKHREGWNTFSQDYAYAMVWNKQAYYLYVDLEYHKGEFEILILNDYGVHINAGNGRTSETANCTVDQPTNSPLVQARLVHTRNEHSQKVEWVKRDQVDISELIPAGHETIPIYPCRGQHIQENTFIPGEFLTAEHSFE